MIKPTEADIGRVVLYQGGHPDDKDRGVITAIKFAAQEGGDPMPHSITVFVRYGAQQHSQATGPESLEWEHP